MKTEVMLRRQGALELTDEPPHSRDGKPVLVIDGVRWAPGQVPANEVVVVPSSVPDDFCAAAISAGYRVQRIRSLAERRATGIDL